MLEYTPVLLPRRCFFWLGKRKRWVVGEGGSNNIDKPPIGGGEWRGGKTLATANVAVEAALHPPPPQQRWLSIAAMLQKPIRLHRAQLLPIWSSSPPTKATIALTLAEMTTSLPRRISPQQLTTTPVSASPTMAGAVLQGGHGAQGPCIVQDQEGA